MIAAAQPVVVAPALVKVGLPHAANRANSATVQTLGSQHILVATTGIRVIDSQAKRERELVVRLGKQRDGKNWITSHEIIV